MNRLLFAFTATILCAAILCAAQTPISSEFTYQGVLRQSGVPVGTPTDFRFRLYDAATPLATQVGPQLQALAVPLSSGRFTVDLDFGAVFDGESRFLEVECRAAGGTIYTVLAPRQALTATPYSSFALHAATAITAESSDNSAQLNGQPASFYRNASNLTGGTLPAGLLSGGYTNPVTFTSNFNSFSGNGAGLTSLNASSLSSGSITDNLLSNNIPRLDAGNTFTSPLTIFSGVVHSTSGGFRFPDGTTQTSAFLNVGQQGFTSGYFSPMTIRIGGVVFPTARLVGSWRLAINAQGDVDWTALPTLRRPRTSDNLWLNLARDSVLLSGLSVTIQLSGGTWTYSLPPGRIKSYRLVLGDDNLPFEEVVYLTGASALQSGSFNIVTVSGSASNVSPPTVAPRLGQSTGGTGTYRTVWNDVRNDMVRIAGNPVFDHISVNTQTGAILDPMQPGTVTLRLNATADALNLDNAFLTGANRTFRLIIHGSPDINCTNNATATVTAMSLRVADDGFPVEEYEVTFPLN